MKRRPAEPHSGARATTSRQVSLLTETTAESRGGASPSPRSARPGMRRALTILTAPPKLEVRGGAIVKPYKSLAFRPWVI